MEQFFVSPTGALQARWKQAFPHAGIAAGVTAIGTRNAGGHGILWLDLTAIPPGERVVEVRAAVGLGWPVVIMTATPGEAEAFRMLKEGAMGYCHVAAAPEQLQEIALVVEHGGLWMPPALMQRFLALSIRVARPRAPVEMVLNELTSRELMVAEQVACGASNREIAEALNITERTVKAHLSAVFEKLGVRDRVQLALAMNNIPTYATVN